MGGLGSRTSLQITEMKQADIIAPVSAELLKAELTPEHFMRDTNHSGNL